MAVSLHVFYGAGNYGTIFLVTTDRCHIHKWTHVYVLHNLWTCTFYLGIPRMGAQQIAHSIDCAIQASAAQSVYPTYVHLLNQQAKTDHPTTYSEQSKQSSSHCTNTQNHNLCSLYCSMCFYIAYASFSCLLLACSNMRPVLLEVLLYRFGQEWKLEQSKLL